MFENHPQDAISITAQHTPLPLIIAGVSRLLTSPVREQVYIHRDKDIAVVSMHPIRVPN